MTIAQWPTELPKPSRKGYGAQLVDQRARRAAKGPPGYRRLFSSSVRVVDLSLVNITRSQKAVFDTFFEQTTEQGALPFYMPDPVTDGWAL